MNFKTGTLKDLWKETNPPKLMLYLGIFLSVVNTGISLVIPLVLKSQLDTIINGFSYELMLKIIILFILELLSMSLSIYFLGIVGQRVVLNIRKRIWDKLLKLEVNFYNKNQSGEIVSRITNDTTVTMNLLSTEMADLFSGLLSIVGSVIILFFLDIPMTLVLLSVIPVVLLVILPISAVIEKVSYERQEYMSEFTGYLSKILSEIRLVKSYNTESLEYDSGKEYMISLYKNGVRGTKIEAILVPLLSIVITATILLVIVYGTYRVQSGYISSGELLAFILYLFQIVAPVSTIGRFVTNLKSATGATKRIFDILKEKEERDLESSNQPSFGDLTLHNVSFKYDDKPILKDISFTIKPNTLTAIVGSSGSGKSTLFFLLERFYHPCGGEIYLNGESHMDINIDKWRQMFSYVSQDSPLMAGTIKENILYGMNKNISQDKITKACILANCHSFIKELPNGYDTKLGERGINLSGGQRQRIAIARAFLRDTPFLLLDEATANLDSQSESVITRAIEKLMHNRTTIVIAHRISTVKNADQIIVIDNGNISGIGTHKELLCNNDLYQTLVYKQSTAS
ncbi:ABC transporter ATP-binding protein [Priestia sp. HNGD-A6]|uniref:ABC transporter ATP-binding protein n=1 Tax=Priestia sp. HNGD-A6 TaxID=3092666 RepID=UPI0038927BC7